MRVFFQTAGKSREFEYSWFILDSSGLAIKLKEIPEPLKSALEVVLSDEISCLLNRSRGLLGFVCTELNSVQQRRSDFNGRKIRNSMGVFAERPNENLLIYSLFVNFLQDKNSWETKVDEWVLENPGTACGITINGNEFLQAITNIPQFPISFRNDFRPTLWPSSEFSLPNFLNSIQKNGLPDVDGIIFLEREYEDEDFFLRKKVVFGISKLIKAKSYLDELSSPIWQKNYWAISAAIIFFSLLLLLSNRTSHTFIPCTSIPSNLPPSKPNSCHKSIPSKTGSTTKLIGIGADQIEHSKFILPEPCLQIPHKPRSFGTASSANSRPESIFSNKGSGTREIGIGTDKKLAPRIPSESGAMLNGSSPFNLQK